MELKFWLLILGLGAQFCYLNAEPIELRVEARKDYEILDWFFRMGVSEEGYGYVLEGVKPISIRDFYPLDQFPVSKDLKNAENEFTNTLLVAEAKAAWNKICSHQKNFTLQVIRIGSPETVTPGWEVQFINISKLKEVIDQNINLFRYVLGATVETEQLVNKITYSNERLGDILNNNLVLTGIVLGFGSHNSLVGGRLETIDSLTISRDCAPFSPKSHFMQTKGDHSLNFLTPERYGTYYLEFTGGGDDTCFRRDLSLLNPSPYFSNVEEELLTLDAMQEPLPPTLRKNPVFIFGAFKGGPSNQPIFNQLKEAQKRVQSLLKKPDFLEQVLEKIGGKKPCIACDKSVLTHSAFALFFDKTDAKEWARILGSVVSNRFKDKERQSAFIKAFAKPSKSSRTAPLMIGVSKAALEGLKKAVSNLATANAQFEILDKEASKDSSLQRIVPKLLYFRTTSCGSGKELKGTERVRLGYIVEDPVGNMLFANHDTWLNLSQTIPGFAHGIQGMRIGEQRTLFIHPALGYGALTTLPPCTELIIRINLLDVDEKTSASLPSITPIDLSWVQNSGFYRTIEESLQQQPSFAGSFYRDMLDKIEGLDKNAVLTELNQRISNGLR